MFKNDKVINGVIIGVAVPAVCFLLFYLIVVSVSDIITPNLYENVSLLFIAINGILIRVFMVNKEKDNIGKGILAVTLLMAIAWVLYFHI